MAGHVRALDAGMRAARAGRAADGGGRTPAEASRPPEEELRFRATHDELTGLPNRAALMEGLREALERLDGSSRLAVLFCDLDGFKDINDGLGHGVGDQVLVTVARRLRQRCRPADLVARFGGDEFVVMLSVDEADQAVLTARRIVEALAEPIVVGDVEVAPGVSVGVAVADRRPDADPVGTLLRDADTAMYHAKKRGRGRYEVFDAGLRRDIARRLELTAALHRALAAITDDATTDDATPGAAPGLQLTYQARRRCGDRTLEGVEVLVVWRHPTLGPIPPDVFVPLAARTGRLGELGEWVLRTAVRDFAAATGRPAARAACSGARPAGRRPTLTVNVSGRQLVGPRLVDAVAGALAAHGVAPHRLILQITQSALADDPDAARAVLGDLRSLGVSIALHDFGTGGWSLSCLRRLPVDQLTIGRGVVADLPTDVDAAAVVAAVLGLGHGMGLRVVAEGVERLEQLQALQEMGCDEYQGGIDGPPGPITAVMSEITRK